ncbi:MAG: thiamine diphosphokinase [Lachnospiraceae bacterium]|nr:thiamine diphosphokinase [Lachnospiraceae bacterium]
MVSRCFIIGAGEFDGFADLQQTGNGLAVPQPDDLVIAADGGYTYLKELGMEPDVLLGDFDSLDLVPEHRHLIRHSPIKDDTDMALAAAYAEEQGCTTFFLYGGLGKRLDHTLANLQLVTGMARKGLEAYLIGQGNIITAIVNETITFSADAVGMISVFCMGECAEGVSESGLKYTLEDAVLTCGRALGVSNEFIGEESRIGVKSGTLLILWDAENGLPTRCKNPEFSPLSEKSVMIFRSV